MHGESHIKLGYIFHCTAVWIVLLLRVAFGDASIHWRTGFIPKIVNMMKCPWDRGSCASHLCTVLDRPEFCLGASP